MAKVTEPRVRIGLRVHVEKMGVALLCGVAPGDVWGNYYNKVNHIIYFTEVP